MKKVLAIALASAVLFGSLAAFVSCGKKIQRYSRTDITVFDTQMVILGYDVNEEEFNKKADIILEKLTYYHRLYDIYYYYEGTNNLKTVNDSAGGSPVKVDQAIIDLLEYAVEMYELTEGMTNVAMGSLLKIWHRYRSDGIDDPENAVLPPIKDLRDASRHCNIEDIIIDKENKTVYLADEKMSLDVGAVAKGYATQMTAEYIKEQGWSGFALSGGGNVKCIGMRADGEKWEVGIQNPDLTSDKAYLTKVYLSTESLVTSGTYQRFYTVDGKEYHHIINPHTLMPENNFASVSIIADHSGLADALSTALFNMTYEEGSAFVDSLDGVNAVWVFENGEIKTTKGFEKLEKQ